MGWHPLCHRRSGVPDRCWVASLADAGVAPLADAGEASLAGSVAGGVTDLAVPVWRPMK